jgi:hypothetical protein
MDPPRRPDGRIRRGNKYNAVNTIINGIKFHSNKEAQYYSKLERLREMGVVSYFLMQVPFALPGSVRYFLDFMIFYPDGRVRCVDVKGKRTAMFIMKKKQVEALYPVTIEEV